MNQHPTGEPGQADDAKQLQSAKDKGAWSALAKMACAGAEHHDVWGVAQQLCLSLNHIDQIDFKTLQDVYGHNFYDPLSIHPGSISKPKAIDYSEVPVAVLVYTSAGHSKPCGATVGANGAGDYATVYFGNSDLADQHAKEHIKKTVSAGHRLTNAILVDGFSGEHALTVINTDELKG